MTTRYLIPIAAGLLALVAGCSSQVNTGPIVRPDAGAVDVVIAVDVPAGLDATAATDVPAAKDAPVVTDAPAVADAPPRDIPTTACASDRECSALGLVCDLTHGSCAECVRDGDCLEPGTVCAANRCVVNTRCTSSRMCPGQVCDVSFGRCVDCLDNNDCPATQVCRLSACVPGPRRCTATADCASLAQVCNVPAGECVGCLTATDCPAGERCAANACVVCTPNAATCASPTARSVCNPDGRASTTTPCAAGPNRTGACAGDGVCTSTCATGFFDCDASAANGCESAVACPSRLVTGLGGPTGFGPVENCLHPNDDGSYAGPPPAMASGVPVDIRTAFPMGLNFFGTTYNSVFVNTNGNISFNAALPTYTPTAFPIAAQPVIAPWWADVDTRGGGQPTNNTICFAVQAGRFIVTWKNVGYYSSHNDRLNSFQLVLTDRSSVAAGDFDVEFRYERCEWTTGDASGGTGGMGGTPAQVGFDAGNRTNYLTHPASRTAAIINVCTTTNVAGGGPGIWRYTVRGGVVTSM